MNRCPACGWPCGNRSWAPPNSPAICVRDRHESEDIAWALAYEQRSVHVVDLTKLSTMEGAL
jgi:hypothetical protein